MEPFIDPPKSESSERRNAINKEYLARLFARKIQDLGVSGSRKPALLSLGHEMQLNADQIEQLYVAGGGRDDVGVGVEHRTGTLFNAAHVVAQSGVPIYYLHFKIEGLAALNADKGHTGADAIVKEARTTIADELKPRIGDVTPVQDLASEFGFLVVHNPAISQSTLAADSAEIAASVGKTLRITISAAVISADDAATVAVLSDQARQAASSAALAARGDNPDANRSSPNTAPCFTSTGTDRRATFRTVAQSMQLSSAQAEELYRVLPEANPDPLTGFERAADREATVRKAAEHVARTGAAAIYVELDVRNLKGLNTALGRSKANEVLARIADITGAEMKGLSGLGDSWPFRHGGDEMSFIVVAQQSDVAMDQLEFAVEGALARAASAVAEATADFADVPHTRQDSPPGTGIVWGTSVIGPDAESSKVFSEADRKVEAKKKQASGHVPKDPSPAKSEQKDATSPDTEVALSQSMREGLNSDLQREVQARAGNLELDRSYNGDPEELREKNAALEAIIKALSARIRGGLPLDEALRDADDKLGELAREMDKKYIRVTAARELRIHAAALAPGGGWESAYDIAVNLMKEGASLEKAKADLGAMLNKRSR
jgi:GGDEF domain-containing protein